MRLSARLATLEARNLLQTFSVFFGSGAWICQWGAWISQSGAWHCQVGVWTCQIGKARDPGSEAEILTIFGKKRDNQSVVQSAVSAASS